MLGGGRSDGGGGFGTRSSKRSSRISVFIFIQCMLFLSISWVLGFPQRSSPENFAENELSILVVSTNNIINFCTSDDSSISVHLLKLSLDV